MNSLINNQYTTLTIVAELLFTVPLFLLTGGYAVAGMEDEVLHITEESKSDPRRKNLYANERNNIPGEVSLPPPSQARLNEALSASKTTDKTLSLKAHPLGVRSPAGEKQFTRIEGFEIGIPGIETLSLREFREPQNMGRGIASGDINKDGFVDILIASKNGIKLYRNKNGIKFNQIELNVPGISGLNTFVVALVDINNDGWLDIFFTSYIKGNYYLLNNLGSFDKADLVKAPSPRILTESLAFGDIDMDGDLDAVLGNWLRGAGKGNADENTLNSILTYDHGSGYSARQLNGTTTGDTLSVLLSDFTGDNILDLIIGNDFKPSDLYYRGDGKGGFKEITREEGIIPVTTNTTMSIDSADFDNDLDLDIYLTQVAAAATGPSVRIKSRPWHSYCDDLKRKSDRRVCDEAIRNRLSLEYSSYTKFKSSNINRCKSFSSHSQQTDCGALHVYLSAILFNKNKLCQLIPKTYADIRFHCKNRWSSISNPVTQDYERSIPVIKNENVMLEATGEKYINIAKPLGIETTAWSWNSKFADFDNDEFQDIYVSNGFWVRRRGAHTKFFFHNQKGKSFIEKTDIFGLQNYMLQPAFTEVDIDNDGDLDILSNSVNGPVWLYRNNIQHNNAIEFEFNDKAGNYFGIGNKIIVHYGDNQKSHQLRESKAGGGFLSFNAPVIHFGMGEHKAINRIEIIWSTGEHSEINGEFPVNAKYIISRKNNYIE